MAVNVVDDASVAAAELPCAAFACQPGYALDRELLPELEAAVAFLQDEVAQLRLGKHDHRLQELIRGPPLPSDKFQTLLDVWKVPAIPAELTEMFRQLQQAQLREQQKAEAKTIDVTAEDDDEAEAAEKKPSVVEISSDSTEESENGETKETVEIETETSSPGVEILETTSQPEQDAAAALASLKALRKSMLLDVLSKIISVAKSKGVDPAMFSSQTPLRVAVKEEAAFMDLETISSDVQSGAISEWEDFANRVYEFCQHVIVDAEKREQQEATQKGVELLHFARTLTETLRKASVKKEESLLQDIGSKAVSGGMAVAPLPRSEDVAVKPLVTESQAEEVVTATEETATDSSNQSTVESDKTAKIPPPGPTQASPKRPSVVVDPLTPNRISARIRQRGSSFSDLTSPQAAGHTPRNDEIGAAAAATGETETARGRKRPRTASNASSATATSSPPTAITVNTASEDDNMSESESQISASEAESQKRRGGSNSRARETASASSSAQTTPVKRAKTRKRRPVLPATRMSSRQQKRRAARAKAATESGEPANGGDDDGEDDDGKDGSENNNNNDDGEDNDNDTAHGEDDEDDTTTNNTNRDAAAAETTESPTPVLLLTKAGRPRKKPGRKPAAWKSKAESK